MEILKNSKSFAITNCGCRTKYKNCDNPIETCFYLDDAADKLVRREKARYISLEEATKKLTLANQHGLIHLTIYHPKHKIKALCSCCECCCHDLQIMRNFKRPDYISHSDYIAELDKSSCINCGLCVQRCIFNALSTEETIVTYNSIKCYECGLCTTTCPTNSITLKHRTPNEIKKMIEQKP